MSEDGLNFCNYFNNNNKCSFLVFSVLYSHLSYYMTRYTLLCIDILTIRQRSDLKKNPTFLTSELKKL